MDGLDGRRRNGLELTSQHVAQLPSTTMFGFPEAALDDRRQRVDLTHWAFDPGNDAPTADLERDMGQQAAKSGTSSH